MMIIKPDHCGNSPKNIFIEDFVFALFNHQEFKDKILDNAIIEIIGLRDGHDLHSLLDLFDKSFDIDVITIFAAVSHGKKGAVDMEIKMRNGSSKNIGIFIEFKTLKADVISYIKIIIA